MNRAPRDEFGNADIVDVTTAELLAALESAGKADDENVFRYFQTTLFGDSGHASGPTLRLTIGQLRKDLG